MPERVLPAETYAAVTAAFGRSCPIEAAAASAWDVVIGRFSSRGERFSRPLSVAKGTPRTGPLAAPGIFAVSGTLHPRMKGLMVCIAVLAAANTFGLGANAAKGG